MIANCYIVIFSFLFPPSIIYPYPFSCSFWVGWITASTSAIPVLTRAIPPTFLDRFVSRQYESGYLLVQIQVHFQLLNLEKELSKNGYNKETAEAITRTVILGENVV